MSKKKNISACKNKLFDTTSFPVFRFHFECSMQLSTHILIFNQYNFFPQGQILCWFIFPQELLSTFKYQALVVLCSSDFRLRLILNLSEVWTTKYNPHIKSCEISCSLGVHPSHRRSEIWFNIFLFLFSIQTVTCFLHARKHDFWYSTNNSFRLVHIL